MDGVGGGTKSKTQVLRDRFSQGTPLVGLLTISSAEIPAHGQKSKVNSTRATHNTGQHLTPTCATRCFCKRVAHQRCLWAVHTVWGGCGICWGFGWEVNPQNCRGNQRIPAKVYFAAQARFAPLCTGQVNGEVPLGGGLLHYIKNECPDSKTTPLRLHRHREQRLHRHQSTA